MVLRRFLFCFVLFFSPALFAAAAAAADDDNKSAAVAELLRAFGAEGGDIENLLQARRAVDAALFFAAVGSLDDSGFPVWGDNKDAPLVVEFSDYQCGFCRRMFPVLQEAVAAGEARVLVVEFPILGAMSERAARAALAANGAGRFDMFHQKLMGGGRVDDEKLRAAVAEFAAGEDAYSEKIDAQLEKNFQLARLLGVQSTPTFIIGGGIFAGAVGQEEFRRMLENARQ